MADMRAPWYEYLNYQVSNCINERSVSYLTMDPAWISVGSPPDPTNPKQSPWLSHTTVNALPDKRHHYNQHFLVDHQLANPAIADGASNNAARIYGYGSAVNSFRSDFCGTDRQFWPTGVGQQHSLPYALCMSYAAVTGSYIDPKTYFECMRGDSYTKLIAHMPEELRVAYGQYLHRQDSLHPVQAAPLLLLMDYSFNTRTGLGVVHAWDGKGKFVAEFIGFDYAGEVNGNVIWVMANGAPYGTAGSSFAGLASANQLQRQMLRLDEGSRKEGNWISPKCGLEDISFWRKQEFPILRNILTKLAIWPGTEDAGEAGYETPNTIAEAHSSMPDDFLKVEQNLEDALLFYFGAGVKDASCLKYYRHVPDEGRLHGEAPARMLEEMLEFPTK